MPSEHSEFLMWLDSYNPTIPLTRRNQHTQPLTEMVDQNMSNIASLIGWNYEKPEFQPHPLVVGTTGVGVEVELEGITNLYSDTRYWVATTDGSLRNNGIEFVCREPWGGDTLQKAVMQLDKWLFNEPSLEGSWRCSTHVHVDVRDMTVMQLKRMILSYLVFEKVLFKNSGYHRYKNNFCVALGFAQEMLGTLSHFWGKEGMSFIDSIISRWDKYTSINFLPIRSQGSVEFRLSEAKWQKGKLIRLINRFLCLKELAMETFEGSDYEFIQYIASKSLVEVFGNNLSADYREDESDVSLGCKLACDVVYLQTIKSHNVVVLNPSEGGNRFRQAVNEDVWSYISTFLEQNTKYRLPEERTSSVLSFEFVRKVENAFHEVGSGSFNLSWLMPSRYYNSYMDFCSQ